MTITLDVKSLKSLSGLLSAVSVFDALSFTPKSWRFEALDGSIVIVPRRALDFGSTPTTNGGGGSPNVAPPKQRQQPSPPRGFAPRPFPR